MLPFCGHLAAATSLLLCSRPDTPTRQLSFHDTLSPLTPSLTSPGIHFSSRTSPTSPPLLPHSQIPAVFLPIRWTISRHYFLRPHPSQYVQPFILHPLILAPLLISKKNTLCSVSHCSPSAPEVPGAYNVNSCSGCVRLGSFHLEVKGPRPMRQDALDAALFAS